MPAPITRYGHPRSGALRAAGLRPIQIWVPDIRHPDFAKECRRQSRLVAVADAAEDDLNEFIDALLSDTAGEA